MKLSKNFALEEFLRSQTAARHGIDMTPPPEVVDNLKELVTTCLQPLRDDVGAAIFISSGYRPRQLNGLIGGSLTSAHIDGRAADFVVAGMTPLDACRRIAEMELPFDQCIHEFGRWVHLGIAKVNRGELLTAYRATRPVYQFGLHPIEELEKGHNTKEQHS